MYDKYIIVKDRLSEAINKPIMKKIILVSIISPIFIYEEVV